MNREIKFRAWDGKSKRMMQPYLEIVTNEVNITQITHNPDWSFWFTNIMQYTGLKDKNGKEIYEGDLLLNPNDNGSDVIPRRVEWSERRCRFVCPFVKKHWAFEYSEIGLDSIADPKYTIRHEIIGNIYENPELL